MKLEMKNVKVYDSMSEETICFEGNLYADGRKVGRVENSGKGGPHRYEFNFKQEAEIDAYCKTLPSIDCMFGGEPLGMDLELWISMEVAEIDNHKWMKKQLNTKVMIVDDTCDEGQSMNWGFKKYNVKGKDTNLMKKFVSQILVANRDTFKNAIVLNLESASDAYKILMKKYRYKDGVLVA